MPTLLNPILSVTSGLGGLLGEDNYGSLGNLLNIQMEMLENISSKLDLIKESLDFIIEHQLAIEQELKATPSKTVAELYNKDIESLFVILKEKIAAYVIEKDKGTLTAEKTRLIFDEILRELQLSRARIMVIGGFVNIPLVATCLHFEMLCMVFAKQPKSYLLVVLGAYKRWFKSIRSEEGELMRGYNRHLGIQDSIVKEILNNPPYKRLRSSKLVHQEEDLQGKDKGEGDIITIRYHYLYFTSYQYSFLQGWEERELASFGYLIDKKTVVPQQIFTGLAFDDREKKEYPVFSFSANSDQEPPFIIAEGFVIRETLFELKSVLDKQGADLSTVAPVLLKSVTITLDGKPLQVKPEEFKGYSEQLLMYASFLQAADDTLEAVEKIAAGLDQFDAAAALAFYSAYDTISTLNAQRIDIWQGFITEKIALIAEADIKDRLLSINSRMQQLKYSEQDILQAYDAAKREFAENLHKDLWDEVAALLEPIGKEIEKAVQALGKEAETFGQDLGKNLEKGIQDLGNQLEKDAHNLGEGLSASVTFVDDQIKAFGKTLTNAQRRLMEGKIVDAIWHIYTDPMRYQDENFAKLVQNSSLVNSIASSAAAIYGGPAGAAAYAAWYTYKQTGDLSLALKTGIITGLTSLATKAINGTEGEVLETDALIRKTLATSAVGAAAIAASGGDERAILEGFLKGAALSVASNYYKSYTGAEIDGKAPTQEPVLKLQLDYTKEKYFILRDLSGKSMLKAIFDDESGDYLYVPNDGIETMTLTQLGRNVSIVGIASASAEGFQLFTETAIPMRLVATLPYMNDMAYFHDLWCDEMARAGISLGDLGTALTIIPATAMTVAGTPTPLLTQIQESALQNKEKLKQQ